MSTRIGVDVGGTFTDLIAYDSETGQVTTSKVPTTPSEVERGILEGVEQLDGAVEHASHFMHGTTVGLNALLTRSGAVVGLLSTAGFRDILELRRGDRGDPFNVLWQPAVPLVPRRLRLEVTERMAPDGSVVTPIDTSSIPAALEVFASAGVDSVVIAFLHAYANPAHELAAAEALRAAGFKGEVTLSHRISGEYREYERTSTAVIDAYIRPQVRSYLTRLSERLVATGFRGDRLVMRSGGGALGFEEAEARAVETVMSGPVAGAQGAAELACRHGISRVVTADVGGTSFDTCLIRDGRLPLLYEGTIAGMPVQTPWVDVRSIGAGGGSLIYVDDGGLLRVGPESAGADPGPVCYGRGGTRPTVTDAAAVLGMLAHGELASELKLDIEAGRRSLESPAGMLGIDVEEAARGALAITAASMAGAIREITVEHGEDPREADLVPFGGAGPLLATLVAQELQMTRILIPPYAGSFSALGLIGADVRQSQSRTVLLDCTDQGIADAASIVAELASSLEEGDETFVALDIRYVGQEHSLTVLVPWEAGRIALDANQLRSRFLQDYEKTFGDSMTGPIELIGVRCERRSVIGESSVAYEHSDRPAAASQQIQAWSFTQAKWLEFDLIDRDTLRPDDNLAGPCIVLEGTATTFVDAGYSGNMLADGTLRLSRVP